MGKDVSLGKGYKKGITLGQGHYFGKGFSLGQWHLFVKGTINFGKGVSLRQGY